MWDETVEHDAHRSILEKLNSIEFIHEKWTGALKEVLDVAIKKISLDCGTTYGIYSIDIEQKNIYLEKADTNNEQYLAKRRPPSDTNISSGLIGEAIASQYNYVVYAKVSDHENYRCGNQETKSELVIKIPDLTSTNKLLGIVNLEANIENAFNDKDGLLFSMIANWAGQFQIRKENELQADKILDYVSSLLSNYPSGNSKYLRRKDIFSDLGRISREITKSYAVAIVLYETEYYNYEILFQENYLGMDEKNQKLSVPSDTFVANQGSTETIGEPTIHEYSLTNYPSFIESKKLPKLKYCLSVCFSYEFENTRKYAAIILGFKEIDIKSNICRRLKFLAKTTSQTIKKLEQIDDRELLVSAINSLDDINTSVTDIHDYLESAAKELYKSVNSTGCVFYQLIDENSGSEITLRDIGSEFRIHNKIFWRDHFQSHIDNLSELASSQNGSRQFLTQHNSKQYNVYARSVKLHKTIIFVSLKELHNYHRDLKISEIHKIVLNVKIKSIESFVKNWVKGNSMDYSLDAFKKVMNSWLQEVVNNKFNKNDPENLLFKAVHEFLQDWNQFAGTEYSAIYLMSETTLKISNASMDHLGATKKGLAPLKFYVGDDSSRNETGKIGLTQKVWKNRESILSFSIKNEGSDDCRNFWKQIVPHPTDSRFFAGVIIKNDQTPLGVLTINGRIPPNVRKLSMEPSILPMLELIAKELGKQIQQIRDKT